MYFVQIHNNLYNGSHKLSVEMTAVLSQRVGVPFFLKGILFVKILSKDLKCTF